MIYLDSSVVLAHLFDEARRPPPDLWRQVLQSSRLLEYEVWNRLHAYGLASKAGPEARRVLDISDLVGLTPQVLARALQPFPIAVRTLDGLHLATMEHLRGLGARLDLASYDVRLIAAAEAMGFGIVPL